MADVRRFVSPLPPPRGTRTYLSTNEIRTSLAFEADKDSEHSAHTTLLSWMVESLDYINVHHRLGDKHPLLHMAHWALKVGLPRLLDHPYVETISKTQNELANIGRSYLLPKWGYTLPLRNNDNKRVKILYLDLAEKGALQDLTEGLGLRFQSTTVGVVIMAALYHVKLPGVLPRRVQMEMDSFAMDLRDRAERAEHLYRQIGRLSIEARGAETWTDVEEIAEEADQKRQEQEAQKQEAEKGVD